MTLYQSGLANDVLLNIHPVGVTENGMIRVNFGSTLNFRDAVIQFVSGRVKLLSHSIRGMVSVAITYSLSGRDEPEAEAVTAPVEAPEEGPGACLLVPPPDKRKRARAKPTAAAAPETVDSDTSFVSAAEEEESSQEESAQERRPRATPRMVCGSHGKLDAGLTLAERLASVNAHLNKDYARRGGGGPGRISNWPLSVCITRSGYIRSKWSTFALLACDDANFFRDMGYADYQIKHIRHDNKNVYSLGGLPVEQGDVLAVQLPNLEALSFVPSNFYLIPRRGDVTLHFQAYANDVPATASDLQGLLRLLIENGNWKYRNSVLEQDFHTRLIWPSTARVVYPTAVGPESGLPMVHLTPSNIFPLQASYSGEAVILEVNTKKNLGSIRQVEWAEKNPFRFADKYYTWNDSTHKYMNAKMTSSPGQLGISEQQCEISSTQLYQGRGTLTNESVQAAICAIFMDPEAATASPLTTYFPKNRLSSSVSYSHIDMRVRSIFVHPTLSVTSEIYQYSLLTEIRNVE